MVAIGETRAALSSFGAGAAPADGSVGADFIDVSARRQRPIFVPAEDSRRRDDARANKDARRDGLRSTRSCRPQDTDPSRPSCFLLRYARLLLSSFSRSNIKIEFRGSQAEKYGQGDEDRSPNSGRGFPPALTQKSIGCGSISLFSTANMCISYSVPSQRDPFGLSVIGRRERIRWSGEIVLLSAFRRRRHEGIAN